MSVIPEVVVEEQVDPDILKLAEVVRDYLASAERWYAAREEFNVKAQGVKDIVEPNTFVVISGGYGEFYGKHFLLTVSDSGNFQVKPIEVI